MSWTSIFFYEFSKNFAFGHYLRIISILVNILKNLYFGKKFSKISILVKIIGKSRFWSKLSETSILVWIFCKILILSKFIENIDFGRNFRKSPFCPKFRKTSILVQNVEPQFRYNFLENFEFPKILTKIKILRKIWPKSRFSDNFDQNRDSTKFRLNSRFSKIATKIEVFQKFRIKSRFSEKLHQQENLDFGHNFEKSRF